ncbi:hypothetical protein HDU98_011223 [Podochytrium sp. JEL0797]|nr:hypothetical protein HDU98_011223 [Podochytrium sp. JEL0797]
MHASHTLTLTLTAPGHSDSDPYDFEATKKAPTRLADRMATKAPTPGTAKKKLTTKPVVPWSTKADKASKPKETHSAPGTTTTTKQNKPNHANTATNHPPTTTTTAAKKPSRASTRNPKEKQHVLPKHAVSPTRETPIFDDASPFVSKHKVDRGAQDPDNTFQYKFSDDEGEGDQDLDTRNKTNGTTRPSKPVPSATIKPTKAATPLQKRSVTPSLATSVSSGLEDEDPDKTIVVADRGEYKEGGREDNLDEEEWLKDVPRPTARRPKDPQHVNSDLDDQRLSEDDDAAHDYDFSDCSSIDLSPPTAAKSTKTTRRAPPKTAETSPRRVAAGRRKPVAAAKTVSKRSGGGGASAGTRGRGRGSKAVEGVEAEEMEFMSGDEEEAAPKTTAKMGRKRSESASKAGGGGSRRVAKDDSMDFENELMEQIEKATAFFASFENECQQAVKSEFQPLDRLLHHQKQSIPKVRREESKMLKGFRESIDTFQELAHTKREQMRLFVRETEETFSQSKTGLDTLIGKMHARKRAVLEQTRGKVEDEFATSLVRKVMEDLNDL